MSRRRAVRAVWEKAWAERPKPGKEAPVDELSELQPRSGYRRITALLT